MMRGKNRAKNIFLCRPVPFSFRPSQPCSSVFPVCRRFGPGAATRFSPSCLLRPSLFPPRFLRSLLLRFFLLSLSFFLFLLPLLRFSPLFLSHCSPFHSPFHFPSFFFSQLLLFVFLLRFPLLFCALFPARGAERPGAAAILPRRPAGNQLSTTSFRLLYFFSAASRSASVSKCPSNVSSDIFFAAKITPAG